MTPNCTVTKSIDEKSGNDLYGDDRKALNDLAPFYNNKHLSDINLIIGENSYPAHKIILCKSSDVFDRMFCDLWDNDKRDLEISEDSTCQKEFPTFLRFLYCNHVQMNHENCLPLLILADKYNVTTLKKVCIDYAESEILTSIDLKKLFTVWFSYATKAYHPTLVKSCLKLISFEFEQIISDNWINEWIELDSDQLIEILKSDNLVIANEYKLWERVASWVNSPSHPERRTASIEPVMKKISTLIRFPFMKPEEISVIECSPIIELHSAIFLTPILNSYKYQALPLAARANKKEFQSKQFLLRQYEDIRWDRRITISILLLQLPGVDHTFTLSTRSSTQPQHQWKWTLKLCGLGYGDRSKDDVLRMFLIAEDIDQSRSVDYMVQIVNDQHVLQSFVGQKTFTKTRYSSELDMDKQIEFRELFDAQSRYICNEEFNIQLILKPID